MVLLCSIVRIVVLGRYLCKIRWKLMMVLIFSVVVVLFSSRICGLVSKMWVRIMCCFWLFDRMLC